MTRLYLLQTGTRCSIVLVPRGPTIHTPSLAGALDGVSDPLNRAANLLAKFAARSLDREPSLDKLGPHELVGSWNADRQKSARTNGGRHAGIGRCTNRHSAALRDPEPRTCTCVARDPVIASGPRSAMRAGGQRPRAWRSGQSFNFPRRPDSRGSIGASHRSRPAPQAGSQSELSDWIRNARVFSSLLPRQK